MTTWLKAIWGFIKVFPTALQLGHEWRKIQVEAKDAVIKAREAETDTVKQRLLLEAAKSTYYSTLYQQEIANLHEQLQKAERQKHTLAVEMAQAMQKVANAVAERTSEFAAGYWKVEFAKRI